MVEHGYRIETQRTATYNNKQVRSIFYNNTPLGRQTHDNT